MHTQTHSSICTFKHTYTHIYTFKHTHDIHMYFKRKKGAGEMAVLLRALTALVDPNWVPSTHIM